MTIDLYELEPAFWPDTNVPRQYEKEDSTYLTDQEAAQIIKEIIEEDLLHTPREDGNTLFATIDDDDNSHFTIFMNLVQRVYPDIDISWFRALDEVSECTYVGDVKSSVKGLRELVLHIKGAKL